MKLIDGNLYLEFSDAIEAGCWTEKYLWKAKSVGSKSIYFIDDPTDRRKVLIEFESLKPEYKEKIKNRFGDPYDNLAKEPIKKMVVKDLNAEKFYMQYRFDGGKKLPVEKVNEYTVAASWLNMLADSDDNKREIKKLLNLNIAQFFIKVQEIINKENICLPENYMVLRRKINQYKEQLAISPTNAYEIIISKKFGNNNAKKVTDDVAESTLLEMIANHNQYDDVFIAYQYKKWAVANNYEPITPATVGNYRRKNEAVIITQRVGSSAFNEKFIRQVKGLRPQLPLSLVEHDDNNLDFLFADDSGYNYNKYVSIVVYDSCTKLPLGYSYMHGKSPEQWQIHHAYLNAMYYIRSLTGGWYLPFEMKADKWASKALTPFYNKVAKFIPPAHGNKHRGYIEQFFGSDHWKRCQKLVSEGNWSGNNITAKNRGVNVEVLNLNGKFRPLIGTAAEQQIENFFHLLRNMPYITRANMEAPSPEQLFLEKWNTLSEADKRPITDEQFLLTFGIKHSHTNAITNRGVEPQISNVKYSFDLPESWMYNKLVGEPVEVYYDPFDFSRVLVTNHKDIRFVAQSAELMPRALKDAHAGSRTYLNALLSEKGNQVQAVSDASEKRKRITGAANHYNAEAMLQGGVMVKDDKYIAEQAMQEEFTSQHEKFLNDNTDFSQFFNNQSLSA